MRPANPVEFLFGSYRRQILALLLLRDEGFHVREIARVTGVPAGSLHRELRALSEAGLLVRQPAGNQVRYHANKSSVIYPELAEIFRKTVGLADVVRDALAPLAEKIDLAFVFGSVAQGRETATSDVDVMVLGKLPFARVVGALSPLRTRLGREINPVVMTRTDFRNKHRGKDRFVARVAKEPKIFLIGTADDFGKQDRAGQIA
jgi:predicted nucleotidyltransferase